MLRSVMLLALWTVAAVSGCAITHEQRLSIAGPSSEQLAQVEFNVAVDGRREAYYSIPPLPSAEIGRFGTVTLRSDDVRHEYSVLSVQSIEVRYVDGTLPPQVKNFSRCQTDFIDGKAELPIHSVYTRCGDAKIIVHGTLHASNGEVQPFECRQNVVVQSDWHFSTWMDWIAAC
jgi:hypothetical protein